MKHMLLASAAAFVLAMSPLAAGAHQQAAASGQDVAQDRPIHLAQAGHPPLGEDQRTAAQPPDMEPVPQDQTIRPGDLWRHDQTQTQDPQRDDPREVQAQPGVDQQPGMAPQQAETPAQPGMDQQQAGLDPQHQQRIEESRQQIQQSIQLLQSDPQQGALQAEQTLVRVEQDVQDLRQTPAGQQAEQQISQIEMQIDQTRQQLNDNPQQAAQSMQQIDQSLEQISQRMQTAQVGTDQQPGMQDQQQPGTMAQPQPQPGMDPAAPATAALTGEEVVGRSAVDPTGTELGEIENVIVGPDGQVHSAILAHGGFLGIGRTRVEIPWDQVQLAEGLDQVVVNMTEEQISALPEYEEPRDGGGTGLLPGGGNGATGTGGTTGPAGGTTAR